ncbi:39S ribosomal protein L51 [Trichuris trichiura]|uniref:Large ribosomal subunit protein mL51 n=1 Tax=Trichuris trichiura TaxID=36087 RepID=A0A077Z237_TRITR|nr:39S ribosomal protein L51 [Trichuris trichiura]
MSLSSKLWLFFPRRFLHNHSRVPRVRKSRKNKHLEVTDYGYYWNYHNLGELLPRKKDDMRPVEKPAYQLKDQWCQEKALFGQNDYIDLLGNGTIHPAQLLYHVPPWLRGFPGQHRANELIKLIHYRNLYQEKMKRNTPKRWHELCKRIKYLLKYHNYKKADEINIERDLGLWEESPDFFYKDKTRRSYLDDP